MKVKMNPLKLFDAYYKHSSGAVYGLTRNMPVDGQKRPEVVARYKINGRDDTSKIDKFSCADGALYFSVKIYDSEKDEIVYYYYKQEGKKIIEIEETDFEDIEPAILNEETELYTAKAVEVDGNLWAEIKRPDDDKYVERFALLESVLPVSDGLLLSVIQGRGETRRPAVYYWKDGEYTMSAVLPPGRMYIR